MSLDNLREVKHGRTPRTCVACKAFKAECQVPVGEGSAAMCWLCAHHVVDHETPVHEAATAECECDPKDIYPAEVQRFRMQHGDITRKHIEKMFRENPQDALRGSTLSEAIRQSIASPPAPVYEVPPEDVKARERGYRSCANWKELYKEHAIWIKDPADRGDS
jgi:hypothetical protein